MVLESDFCFLPTFIFRSFGLIKSNSCDKASTPLLFNSHFSNNFVLKARTKYINSYS